MTSSRDDNVVKNIFHIAYNTRSTIFCLASGRLLLYICLLLSLPRYRFVSISVYPAVAVWTNSQNSDFWRDIVPNVIKVKLWNCM